MNSDKKQRQDILCRYTAASLCLDPWCALFPPYHITQTHLLYGRVCAAVEHRQPERAPVVGPLGRRYSLFRCHSSSAYLVDCQGETRPEFSDKSYYKFYVWLRRQTYTK